MMCPQVAIPNRIQRDAITRGLSEVHRIAERFSIGSDSIIFTFGELARRTQNGVDLKIAYVAKIAKIFGERCGNANTLGEFRYGFDWDSSA